MGNATVAQTKRIHVRGRRCFGCNQLINASGADQLMPPGRGWHYLSTASFLPVALTESKHYVRRRREPSFIWSHWDSFLRLVDSRQPNGPCPAVRQ